MTKTFTELLQETERLNSENAILHQQLHEALQSIDAIRSGKIDALVIGDKKNRKILTETTADKIYRILIEKMHEGAVTLNEDGVILYCNSYFANMVNLPLQKITGTKFKKFISGYSKERVKKLFTQGEENVLKEEVNLHASNGNELPVLLTANSFSLDNIFVLSIILTDLTIQKINLEELEQTNKILLFQSKEIEQRAAELVIANRELLFQSKEKENRSAELIVANKELQYQNNEKEKRAAELLIANKELEAFNYISSHDLQEPLRKIQTFSSRILEREKSVLSDIGKQDFKRIQSAAHRMQTLIEDLLSYSHTNISENKFEPTDLNKILAQVKDDLNETIWEKRAIIETDGLCTVNVIPFQFRQLMVNLINNALKFAIYNKPPHIILNATKQMGHQLQSECKDLPAGLFPDKEYCHISVTDNGIGFEPQYKEQIFGVFKRLHSKEAYEGTGIGLAIVKKIVENHNGFITATGELNKGARFDIYLPA